MSEQTNDTPQREQSENKSAPVSVSEKIKTILRKFLGRQTVVFLIFLFISGILWLIMSLNENMQRNLTCEIQLTNVPDSVTLISRMPSSVTVNVSGKGTGLVKYQFGSEPVVNINFNTYRNGNRINVSESELSSIIQNSLGSEVHIQRMDLDSINVLFTTLPGVEVPVKIDCNIKPVITARLSGAPVSDPSKVKLYGVTRESLNISEISTEPIDYKNVKESFEQRVRLITPRGVRAVPDTVTVKVKIETLLYRSEEVPVTVINTPANINIIPNPPTVKVDYLVPESQPDAKPDLSVIADFKSLNGSLNSEKIRIRLLHPDDYVFLSTDSVYYLAEIHQFQ